MPTYLTVNTQQMVSSAFRLLLATAVVAALSVLATSAEDITLQVGRQIML
jgi:hypothetical protein